MKMLPLAISLPVNTFNDTDGELLTYSASLSDDSALPAWLSFDAATQTFSGTAGNHQVGAIEIKVTASDATASVSDEFSLTVNNVNDAPFVSSLLADQQATQESAFSFTVPANSFSDIDAGDSLTVHSQPE